MSDSKDIVQLLKRGCVCSSEFGKCIRCEAAEHIEHLKAEVERLQTAGVHTCHDQCQRYACVQFRRAEAAEAQASRMRDALEKISDRTRDGQHCALIASEALEDSSTGNS